MHVFSPLATFPNAKAGSAEASGERLSRRRMAVRQFFRPGVLAFLSLALAVGGWAYGNKLSHYFHLFSVAKASSPRIWVDHRDDGPGAQVHQADDAHKLVAAVVLAISVPQNPQFTAWFILATPHPARVAFPSSSLVPFRAPPSLNSSLA